MTTDQGLVDKTLRSVFVGNIPYEVSEEKLKDIFSEVGPVLSFKLVFDRESGKPKGYGFCEYKDQETAQSAMRNLNNYEIGGRTLRVDNACTEKSRIEMQTLMQGTLVGDSQYGEVVGSDKAPETISKAVASLPPEQMYELMKQMKQCIQNNPVEARQMLLQNPQLAYALLQAQIVMRIVEPHTAAAMLHERNVTPPPLEIADEPQIINSRPSKQDLPPHSSAMESQGGWNNPPVRTMPAPQPNIPNIQAPPMPPPMIAQDMDMRLPPSTNRFADQDLRIPPSHMMPMQNSPFDNFSPRDGPRVEDRDPRTRYGQQSHINMIPPMMPPPPSIPPMGGMSSMGPPMMNMARNIPNTGSMTPVSNVSMQRPPPQATASSPSISSIASIPTPPILHLPSASSILKSSMGQDKDKAAIIMQVLQLTDEQIAKLPGDQRQSIMVLKEQIVKSTKR